MEADREPSGAKERWSRIVFRTDTPWAKGFDVILLIAIFLSVSLVILESYEELHRAYESFFYKAEWIFTGLFTLEYIARLYLAKRPLQYAKSFFGVIDLLAVLPTYLELFLVGPHYLMVVRALRLLRLFRILKITRFVQAEDSIKQALRASRPKIIVFLASILLTMLVIGSAMYLIEGPSHGFDNIPISVYWALNTMTPVSEGDLTAQTAFGQAMAALLMFFGYALLAIPTGIISSEVTRATLYQQQKVRTCPSCGRSGHDSSATFCKYCGAALEKGKEGLE